MQSQTGGYVYGQGVHGRVIDISSTDPEDTDTFASFLEHEWNAKTPLLLYTLKGDGSGYDIVRLEGSPLLKALKKAVVDASGKLVAKVFVGSDRSGSITVEDAFVAELEVIRRLYNAFGKSKIKRMTAVQGLEVGKDKKKMVVHGLKIAGVFVVFNSKCEADLETHKMNSYSDVSVMIDQILESLSHIHKEQVLHADIKLSNMMYCGSKSYKLIDWGASATFDEIRALYLATKMPRNIASPMAWFAWGITDDTILVNRKQIHKIIHAKMVRRQTLFIRPEFQEFVESSFESYQKALEKLYKKHKGLDTRVRKAIIDTYMPSFDLYNFGLAVMAQALSPNLKLTEKQAAVLIEFATRLTHYDHAEFVGNDAKVARRLWSVSKNNAPAP